MNSRQVECFLSYQQVMIWVNMVQLRLASQKHDNCQATSKKIMYI